MEMIIDFPGGARVDAHFNSYTIHTDQPIQAGGEASAPTPFATFLAALGTCAGIYVLGFCQRRGIATEGLRLVQRVETESGTRHGPHCAARHRAAGRVSRAVSRGRDSRGRTMRSEKAPRAPAGLRGQHRRARGGAGIARGRARLAVFTIRAIGRPLKGNVMCVVCLRHQCTPRS